MKAMKFFGAIGALIAAALVGGALIGSVAAETPTASGSPSTVTNDADAGQYCQSFRSHLADQLKTDAAGLQSAFRAAADATLDEAVANGDLTRERADAIKSRLADADLDGCFRLGRKLVGHPGVAAYGVDLGAAAADALDMQPSALAAQLRSGKSLQEIAKARGVDYTTVKKAVLDAAKTDLDKAVSAGKLTAEQEQKLLERLSTALDSGDWPPARPGRGHGPGFGNPKLGPWNVGPNDRGAQATPGSDL
jgi:3-hydroxyacyl-CoA dehydrogenase